MIQIKKFFSLSFLASFALVFILSVAVLSVGFTSKAYAGYDYPYIAGSLHTYSLNVDDGYTSDSTTPGDYSFRPVNIDTIRAVDSVTFDTNIFGNANEFTNNNNYFSFDLVEWTSVSDGYAVFIELPRRFVGDYRIIWPTHYYYNENQLNYSIRDYGIYYFDDDANSDRNLIRQYPINGVYHSDNDSIYIKYYTRELTVGASYYFFLPIIYNVSDEAAILSAITTISNNVYGIKSELSRIGSLLSNEIIDYLDVIYFDIDTGLPYIIEELESIISNSSLTTEQLQELSTILSNIYSKQQDIDSSIFQIEKLCDVLLSNEDGISYLELILNELEEIKKAIGDISLDQDFEQNINIQIGDLVLDFTPPAFSAGQGFIENIQTLFDVGRDGDYSMEFPAITFQDRIILARQVFNFNDYMTNIAFAGLMSLVRPLITAIICFASLLGCYNLILKAVSDEHDS